MDGAKAKAKAVVGILGEDPLTSRIFGVLLAQEGYEARTLDATALFEDPSAALAGVDLVLFVPGLSDERRGALVGVLEGAPATAAAVPVVNLSSALKAGPPDERAGSVPWPWSTEDLVGAIERALLLAPAHDGAQASSQAVAPWGVPPIPGVPATTLLPDPLDGRQEHP